MAKEDLGWPVELRLLVTLERGVRYSIGIHASASTSWHVTAATWSWFPLDGGQSAFPPKGGPAEFSVIGISDANSGAAILRLTLYSFGPKGREAVAYIDPFSWPPPPFEGECSFIWRQNRANIGTWRMVPAFKVDYGVFARWTETVFDNIRSLQHSFDLYRDEALSSPAKFSSIATQADCAPLHHEFSETLVSFRARLLLGRELNYYFEGILFRYFNLPFGALRSFMATWKKQYLNKVWWVSDNDVWAAQLGYDEEPHLEQVYDGKNRGYANLAAMDKRPRKEQGLDKDEDRHQRGCHAPH